MATTFQLNGTVRTDRGKGAARKIRADKGIPAVLYGKGTDPIMLRLDLREFLRTVSGHAVSNMIIDIETGSEDTFKALIREIQVDPLTNEVLHVDLNRVSLTEKIEIEVPLELVGVPEGVKNFGGILQHPVRSVTVLCLATEVPDKIRIDVSGLLLNQAIHVSEIDAGGLEIVSEPHIVVASVAMPAAEEVAAAPAEGEAVAEAGDKPSEGEKDEKSGDKKTEKKEDK